MKAYKNRSITIPIQVIGFPKTNFRLHRGGKKITK